MKFSKKLSRRVGLSLAPLAMSTLLTSLSAAPGCSSAGPQPAVGERLGSYGDDPCLAALGTPEATSACAGSRWPAIAKAQLDFTVTYVDGRAQCAGSDVSSAADCYAANHDGTIGQLRSVEAALAAPVADDFGTDNDVWADAGAPDGGDEDADADAGSDEAGDPSPQP